MVEQQDDVELLLNLLKNIQIRTKKELKTAGSANAVSYTHLYKEGINVADAAVYISPNMTRDLLRMRGVWSPA